MSHKGKKNQSSQLLKFEDFHLQVGCRPSQLQDCPLNLSLHKWGVIRAENPTAPRILFARVQALTSHYCSHASLSHSVLLHTPHSHRCNNFSLSLSLSELVKHTDSLVGITPLFNNKGAVWSVYYSDWLLQPEASKHWLLPSEARML